MRHTRLFGEIPAWFSVMLLLNAPLGCSDTSAKRGIPAWTDDSALVLEAGARRLDLSGNEIKLDGRLLHPVDVAARARWALWVLDSSGQVRRQFWGTEAVSPDRPLHVRQAWNGRDAAGAPVGAGLYRLRLDVELRAEDHVARGPLVLAAPERGAATSASRVQVLRQSAIEWINVDSPFSRSVRRQAVTPLEPGFPFNFYFGTLHSQTRFSDGGHRNDSSCTSSTSHDPTDFDPAQAFAYARNVARVDFLGITDHNHQFDVACPGCTAGQVIQRYRDGLAAASAATVDGSFVGIYGMEWGYIGTDSFPNEGHVNIFESPKLFGWKPSSCTLGIDCFYEVFTDPAGVNYSAMYTSALANPSPWGAFGEFNHPSDNAGLDFNEMQYTTDADDFIHLIAVSSGPATTFSTTSTVTGYRYAGENAAQYSFYASIDMYNRALGAGFHVAPTADSDVHCSNYGNSTRDRTVILSTALTKAALFDAIHNRRVYATTNRDAQLGFTLTAGTSTFYMGAGGIRTVGPVATSGAITLRTSVLHPDPAQFAVSIKIKEPVPNNPDGSATLIATGTASPFSYTFTPTPGGHAYYVYITMNTGDELWSAPIWINQL